MLDLHLAGVSPEPTQLGALHVDVYSLSSVVVQELEPPGGPFDQPSDLIISGLGFADYGSGQLVCTVGGVNVAPASLEPTRFPTP